MIKGLALLPWGGGDPRRRQCRGPQPSPSPPAGALEGAKGLGSYALRARRESDPSLSMGHSRANSYTEITSAILEVSRGLPR